jgi:hypothetical protein
MPQTTPRKRKKAPKRILALPDLEHAKSAVLNGLTSTSGQRTYDHAIREFVGWYCSEPRLAFKSDSGPPPTAFILNSGSTRRPRSTKRKLSENDVSGDASLLAEFKKFHIPPGLGRSPT